MIYTFDQNSDTLLVIITCDIPNKREYFSLFFDRSVIEIKFDIRFSKFKTDCFHFCFF